MSGINVSQLDIQNLALIRKNVIDFMKRSSFVYSSKGGRLLDIAPQVHEGASPFFSNDVIVDTLDIDPDTNCTFTGDICQTNDCISNDTYDYVVCTEVLEHTVQPFHAINEIWRILKPEGLLFLSTPLNFRIHGPLPDCWRFTEHGLRVLLSQFSILELCPLETKDRPLMPIQYTVVAKKNIDTKL